MATDNNSPAFARLHGRFERRAVRFALAILGVLSVGGLVEIAPLFALEGTVEKVAGMRPYTPLELAGRGVYVREGCYVCHSQQIRPFRDEVERYGPYSLAAESMYDHPFQWGSKRTGPDLARIGNKYSDAWHVRHLVNPRDVVPASIMPSYSFLATTPLPADRIGRLMRAHSNVGVPYTDEQLANARADLVAQADPEADTSGFSARYAKAQARNFDGQPGLTEMDALVAYLQMLGTLAEFDWRRPSREMLR
ncbi:cytochrome-c oxidase, cbb3-type subunit II [Belnapia rosea]|uniref:cytochrome-c oxidase, cbb3-type subunit II n=1 Tax=Belnapia rosea TaxID=938405 RepID=UPI00089093FC|nr:cytochrome-c oxidase, cbb3-type subunit II [Belnapia rosea]SDB74724.1 cytochrome c oxidase cbb3-type subunit 2 [Belnapia rosea]